MARAFDAAAMCAARSSLCSSSVFHVWPYTSPVSASGTSTATATSSLVPSNSSALFRCTAALM